MILFPNHPDLIIFQQITYFLFLVGLLDIFYLIIKVKLLKRNIRKKDHSWQGFWIMAILLWLFTWGIYLLDRIYNIDLIN